LELSRRENDAPFILIGLVKAAAAIAESLLLSELALEVAI